jgi:DNA-directed RNA polymerase specialized sigma24 family protein
MVVSDVRSFRPSRTEPSGAWGFDAFFAEYEPRVRRALVATYGAERGREAAAEAFAWAWEHRSSLSGIDRPVGYLYRVGQSKSRPRRLRRLYDRPLWPDVMVEPELAAGLAQLSERQRVIVVLVHGFDWTVSEVAELLNLKVSSVNTHLNRGLKKLRSRLEDGFGARTG